MSTPTASHILLVNHALEDFFSSQIASAETIGPRYVTLWRTMERLVIKGGKRLRPLMTIKSYQAFGGTDVHAILPTAVAQELLHASLLIHDDIIDNDDIRYGIANINGTYKKEYAAYLKDPADTTHYAHGAAILAGDLLLAAAHAQIATSLIEERHKLIAQRLLAASIFEVAGGELLDTEAAFIPVDDPLSIARYKTAGYSFIYPLLTGAMLADAPEVAVTILREFAEKIGIAYQLSDDLLGIFGDPSQTGKSASSDISEGKRTYMVERFYANATTQQITQFNTYFGKRDSNPGEIEMIRQLLVSSGAKSDTEALMDQYSSEASDLLERLETEFSSHEHLHELVARATKRTR